MQSTGQGFPDFNPDTDLLDLVSKACRTATINIPEGRHCGICARKSPTKWKPAWPAYDWDTEITVTAGATEA